MTGWAIGAAVTLLVVVLVAAVTVVLRREPRATTGPAGPVAPSGRDTGLDATRRDLAAVVPGGGSAPVRGVVPPDLSAPGGRLVLLQLSAAFCSECRDTRSVVADVAGDHPVLTHRDLDVALRPELVRLLGVRGTPTTLLVDEHGVELLRIAGVPRRAALGSAVAPHLPAHGDRSA